MKKQNLSFWGAQKKQVRENKLFVFIFFGGMLFVIIYVLINSPTLFGRKITTNNSGSPKGNNTGRDYIPLVSKGISENGIWGTRCYYSNGKVLEIESSRSVQIQGGWPPKCPSKY